MYSLALGSHSAEAKLTLPLKARNHLICRVIVSTTCFCTVTGSWTSSRTLIDRPPSLHHVLQPPLATYTGFISAPSIVLILYMVPYGSSSCAQVILGHVFVPGTAASTCSYISPCACNRNFGLSWAPVTGSCSRTRYCYLYLMLRVLSIQCRAMYSCTLAFS
jgi:hypothetical protein